MFSMFDELKEEVLKKKIIRLNRFQEPYNEKSFKKTKAFEESPKSRGVFRTRGNIYDGAFLLIYLTALYFRNKSFIIDVPLGYK